MFCDNCNQFLKKEGGYLVCIRCNLKKKDAKKKLIKPLKIKIETLKIQKKQTTKQKCLNCFHNVCYITIKFDRAPDEPETKIFQCTKCNKVWKE